MESGRDGSEALEEDGVWMACNEGEEMDDGEDLMEEEDIDDEDDDDDGNEDEENNLRNQLDIPDAMDDIEIEMEEVTDSGDQYGGIDDRLTPSTSCEEETETIMTTKSITTGNVIRVERLEVPSWVHLVYGDNELRVEFHCLCQGCAWTGAEEIDLILHLQTHVSAECNRGRRENEVERPFINCIVPFCNRTFPSHEEERMIGHLCMHSHHAGLQKNSLIAIKSRKEFAHLTKCGHSTKLSIAHNGEEHICMWDECNVGWLAARDYFDHSLSHLDYLYKMDSREEFVCLWDECGAKFKNKSTLLPHYRHHIGLKMAACPFCGEFFSAITKLHIHLGRKLEDKEGKSLLCKLCRKPFPNEESLKMHCKRHLMKVKCGKCGVQFHTKYDLNRHFANVHSENAPLYVCSFPNCIKTFGTNSRLIQHLRKHSAGEMQCSLCPEKFRWLRQLTKHVRLVHDKSDSEYTCHLCSKKYEEGSSLTRHLKNIHRLAIPDGFARFQYKKCVDGLFRLQTDRPV